MAPIRDRIGRRSLVFAALVGIASCARLDAGWQMQRASAVAALGSSVATRDAETRDWYNITVPCTVLGCLQQQVGNHDAPYPVAIG
jgi:hypothetical protein